MPRKELSKNSSDKSNRSNKTIPQPVNYVSIDEAISMIPYVKSYCKSVKYKHYIIRKMSRVLDNIVRLTSSDPEKKKKIDDLRDKLSYKMNVHLESLADWVKELRDVYVSPCSLQSGCLDIPIWSDELKRAVMLCINEYTITNNLVWHGCHENYIAGKPFRRKNNAR